MSQEFDANVKEKYGKLKTLKSFLDLCIKAYDDNLEGLLKFLSEDNETLERNMLTEMNNGTVSEFVDTYGINPEILVRLLTKLGDSVVEPLVEGYYDRTNDFGDITNSEHSEKKKKKKKKPKKTKTVSIKNRPHKKRKPKRKKPNKRAQTDALYAVKQPPQPKAVSPLPRGRAHQKHQQLITAARANKPSTKKSKSAETPVHDSSSSADSVSNDVNEQKTETHSISHGLLNTTSLEQYLDEYHRKFVHFNENPKESLTFPLTWTCLYYHQMGIDLEFDILEDVTNDTEKTDILWKEWKDKRLIVNKAEYDSDDNKDKEDEDALLTQVPDFIYDFYKDMKNSYDIYKENNGTKSKLYSYRIRRWISPDLQQNEVKQIPQKFRNLPRYSWIADKVSYLEDYMLTDDLIVIQNKSLLSKPTWFKWMQQNENNNNGLDFIRNSGFFKTTTGIYSLLNDAKINILDSGICAVGDFKFGKQPTDDDLDLYGIIRLDVLVPALLRFPLYEIPMINIGKLVLNNAVISSEIDCKLPQIQKGGLCFDNIQRYENQRGNKDVAIKVDLKPLIASYNDRGELRDIWTLFICFAHPMPNQNGQRSTLLFKKHCFHLLIENEYDNEGKKLIKEELVLKIFSMNSGSRYVDIFRKKIKSNDARNVNTLAISFDGVNGGKLFCALNGRQVTLLMERINRTNLLNLKKSSHVLIGHKCSSGDVGSVQNLFNGYLFEFCIYPKCFHEFELRAFEKQCELHIQKYCKLLHDYQKQ